MTGSVRNKQVVEENLTFLIDYPNWLSKLTELQKRILDYLYKGYKTSKIAEMIGITTAKVKLAIQQLKELFVEYFVLA